MVDTFTGTATRRFLREPPRTFKPERRCAGLCEHSFIRSRTRILLICDRTQGSAIRDGMSVALPTREPPAGSPVTGRDPFGDGAKTIR